VYQLRQGSPEPIRGIFNPIGRPDRCSLAKPMDFDANPYQSTCTI
jgi:hypothetical protein